MTNHHDHLLIETPYANLSKGIRQLNGVYAQGINRTYARGGHLFQGRFKSILVQKDRYLLELTRYVVLNPVRAGMVRHPEDWPWSSYRATVGLVNAPAFLTTDWGLGAFAEDRQGAVARYRRFVAAGAQAANPWLELKSQVYLGSKGFFQCMQARIAPDRPLQEIPRQQRRSAPKLLAYFSERYPERDDAMA